MSFQDYRKFIDLYDQITLEDRAKISEFNLQNLALTDLNLSNQNPNLWDLQLIALTFWMSHEEARTT